MDKVWAATGLLTKHLVPVVIVTMQGLTMRKNVQVTVARLLNDGEKCLPCSWIFCWMLVRNHCHTNCCRLIISGTMFLILGWSQPETYWLCSRNWAGIRTGSFWFEGILTVYVLISMSGSQILLVMRCKLLAKSEVLWDQRHICHVVLDKKSHQSSLLALALQ